MTNLEVMHVHIKRSTYYLAVCSITYNMQLLSPRVDLMAAASCQCSLRIITKWSATLCLRSSACRLPETSSVISSVAVMIYWYLIRWRSWALCWIDGTYVWQSKSTSWRSHAYATIKHMPLHHTCHRLYDGWYHASELSVWFVSRNDGSVNSE